MARRYGKLPSELMELTLFDFNFNIRIMNRVIQHENMEANNRKMMENQKKKR